MAEEVGEKRNGVVAGCPRDVNAIKMIARLIPYADEVWIGSRGRAGIARRSAARTAATTTPLAARR